MATLKISDLSVGDWVGMDLAELNMPSDDLATAYIEELRKPIRIKGISEDSEMVLADIEEIDGRGSIMLKCEYLKPIPITAEILEKNGFTLCEDCTSRWKKEFSSCCVFVTAPEGYASVTVYKRVAHGHRRVTDDLQLNGVHDLQHALRLAGSDKEINL